MLFNNFHTSVSSISRLVSAVTLGGLFAGVAQANDDLLVFTRESSAERAHLVNLPAKQRPQSDSEPAVRPSGSTKRIGHSVGVADSAIASFSKDKPVSEAASAKTGRSGGVSAVEYLDLPPRMVERARAGTPVMGPSERDLKKIFLQAVETAIARSPQILRSKSDKEAAVSDIDEAKGQRWPQVDVGTQTNAMEFGGGAENDYDSGGVNVSVTTMLYDWGRIDQTIQSREKLALASDENLVAEIENLGYEVVATIAEHSKQRLIGELSQDFADRMEELVNMLAGIVEADPGRSSELTQAKARLLQARALRDTAQAKARDAEITLQKLVGDRPISIPQNKEWNLRLADLNRLLTAVEEHPTIRQASAEADSAELDAKAVKASGLPQLNWNVSKSAGEDSLGQEQPWQTNLSVTWGVFRGGSTRAAERAALQRSEASRHQMSQQRRDLEFKIRSADNDARSQLERAELYRDLSVESDRIREAFYMQWHHLGKRTLLDVLIAENDHYSNQVSEITNRFDAYRSIFTQYANAGILFQWLHGEG